MRADAARLGTIAVAGTLLAFALLRPALSESQAVERVSVSSAGIQGGAASSAASVSADGRFVAFASDAADLVPGDGNFERDVFLHDRVTGVTELVSRSTAGAPGNDTSAGLTAGPPRVSADGRFVVFASEASNLVPDDTNGVPDVFIRDRMSGTTERISRGLGEEADGDSVTPSVSEGGRYVTFTSLASNLAPHDDNNDRDVFLHDRALDIIEMISVASDGTRGNLASGGLGAGPARVSADGRYVVFGSFANNLVEDDTNGFDDVFVRDRVANTTERVSVSTDGAEGNGHSVYGSISDDGRLVAFGSPASTLTPGDTNGAQDIFLHDRDSGTTVLLSDAAGGGPSNGNSTFPVISADGSSVAFQSDAADLIDDDANNSTDVFVQDIATGGRGRASAGPGGAQGNGGSIFADISGDGTVAVFESLASNLVSADTNGARDVFAWGKPLRAATPTPTRTRTPTPSPTPPAGTGDVDCSGAVTSIDAALVLQLGAGFPIVLPCPAAADVNGNGRIDAVDAALILQFVAGLLDGLPP